MAIQRIPGEMLENNLTRGPSGQKTDLAFETDLLYLDVVNGRIGVGTDSPSSGTKLDVNGATRIRSNLTVDGDVFVKGSSFDVETTTLEIEDPIILLNQHGSGADIDSGIMIDRGAENNAALYWNEGEDCFKAVTTTSNSDATAIVDTALARIQVADPVGANDVVTKAYFEANSSAPSLLLGYPDDSTYADGAYIGMDPNNSIADAIDDLNETMENIRNGTFVKSVDFTADVTTGSAGLTVTLTITTVGGGADEYDIDWGTGETATIATSDSTPSHTYNSNTNSPFSITVTARASGATSGSAGSFAEKTRTNYIVIYTAAPTVSFNIYAASSGGSSITKADDGATVYLENTSTNTTIATVAYTVNWGDGNTDTVASDSAAGGVSGSRLSHTYNNSSGDTRYQITLTLTSHSTADPAEIPKATNSYFYVYSVLTPQVSITDSTSRGINEESTAGFPVTFKQTENSIGDYTTFNTNSTKNYFTWDFGEGSGEQQVNAGSNAAGDHGVNISNTFNLTSGQQSGGTTVNYTVTLRAYNGHSSSPFSDTHTITVEPDVRANIAATAVTVSTASGDTQYDLYDTTDLDGNNRALVRFTNTSQNADNYLYDYFDDSSSVSAVTEDGISAGTIAATIDKNFTGTSNGAFITRFHANGAPDTFSQGDEETLSFTMNAVPSAPAGLSTKSLTMSDSAQGTSPKLCAGFDDNTSSFTSQTAGDSLSTTTARRYTSGTIDTSVVSNFYNGASGTLAASINNSADGSKAFTTAEGETGTFTSLVVTSNVDYDTVNSAYPQRLYLVASAKITKALTGYTVGSNAQRLEHSTTGNTNLVYVVRDDITSVPTTTIGTVAEGTAGTYQYISGVPFYDSGSPTLTVTGTTVANFTGQAYADVSNPVEIDPGTRSTGSGDIISATDYTYANVDGASSMLTGGIPNADTGVGSAYTLGTLTANITTSNIFAIQRIKARARNCNGVGSYSESSTDVAVFTATATGLNKENGGIVVSDSLGSTYDDDAVRIADFIAETTDTPSFNGATNFYTNDVFSGAESVSGTREATVIPTSTSTGAISHDTTDYSTRLPAGPDRSADTGTQYYTFAFRRSNVANFTVTMTGTVSGFFIAAPGTQIDSTSGLNGWLDASTTYGGSGVPGSNTGSGGNGSNGCAFTSGDRIQDGVSYSSQSFTLTLGAENGSNATGNVILVRIKLNSGDNVTALSIS